MAADEYEFFGEDDGVKFETNEGDELTQDEVVSVADQLRAEVLEADEDAEEPSETPVEDPVVSEDPETPEDAPEPAEAPQKPAHSPLLVAELRKRDRKGKNKTCKVCVTRKLYVQMENGNAEICDDCKAE